MLASTVRLPLLVLAIAAPGGCGRVLGIGDLRTTDAQPAADTPPAVIDAMPITLSGVVKQNDNVAVPGAMVELVRSSDQVQLAEDTANGIGAYSLVAGAPIDGELHAREGVHDDTVQYLAAPLTLDSVLTIIMFTPTTIAGLATDGGTTQPSSAGFVFVEVLDAGRDPVEGAVVTVTSGRIRYIGAGGVPDAAATATSADGFGFAFGASPGPEAITVQAPGASGSRTVTVVGATATIVPIIVE